MQSYAGNGTLTAFAQQLHQELSLTGYSLLLEDMLHALQLDAQYYASWAVLEVQNNSTVPILINENTPLQLYEWAIIEPVFRSHCDLLQARLVEGSRSLGGDGFGLSVAEANQLYTESKKIMQNEAFIEPPISFKTFEGL
ncbi:hypothetical protein [Acinetobacter boissieri]|uniref:Uncharacterized protein n=1 Tax=Acinetobacter boissieri TaxID=1219383 RepID=A0A1G6GYE9_9GAMM|nr:hypothetical protein [Acinetobacter boissieri]SDB86908.1 hypothetical protein SAMN05421733_10318 [Acinetobacter boissieri]